MPVDVDARVLYNTRLSADYHVLALDAPQIAADCRPGQFVMIKMARGNDPLLRRPFSVFQILRDDGGAPAGLTLLSKRVGSSTRLMFDAAPDDRFLCLGPLGRPFVPIDPPVAAWLVAGGVGLAPFVMLAEVLRTRGTETTLFYGARTADELFCLDVFERLNVRLVLATEDGRRGDRGRVTVPLERELRNRSADAPVTVYACGPEGMLAACARLAMTYGRPSQVSVERVMGCGLGGCYSCVVPVRDERASPHYLRSCLAGPVFRGEDVVW
jgi:dihydroorotate dehydrogenase electron transfer subunit